MIQMRPSVAVSAVVNSIRQFYDAGSGVTQTTMLGASGSAPALYEDFTTGQALDPRITFTRGSSATRFDSTGTLVTMGNNEPRFDYDPVTLQPKGLLIEEQRTNLLTYSEQFDNAAWAKGGQSSVAVNAIIAPDGTLSGDTFTITGTDSGCYQSVTVAASTVYTWSWYVKLGTMPASDFKFAVYNNTNAAFIAADVIPTQTPNASGWTRISYSFTTPVGCTSVRVYSFRNASAANSTYSVWGAQLEAGAFPTSYIPTTTAAATRAADVAVMTGTNFSSWYNQTEGTLFAETDSYPSGGATQRRILYAGTSSDRMDLRFAIDGVSTGFNVVVGGVAQAAITGAGTASLTKIAAAYKVNDFAAATNSVLGTPDTSGSLPAVSQLAIGSNGSSEAVNGHIKRIAYYPRRLSNTELQVITA